MPNRNGRASVREVVLTALSQIVGLRLTSAHRAADMRTFQFGPRNTSHGELAAVFALHVQCPWRIDGVDGIVTGRSDLWEPIEEGTAWQEDWDYESGPNLQDMLVTQWLAKWESSMVVTKVDSDEYGGAAIWFEHNSVIRLFPAGSRGEEWRFFKPKSELPHLVIVGGEVDSGTDDG